MRRPAAQGRLVVRGRAACFGSLAGQRDERRECDRGARGQSGGGVAEGGRGGACGGDAPAGLRAFASAFKDFKKGRPFVMAEIVTPLAGFLLGLLGSWLFWKYQLHLRPNVGISACVLKGLHR